MKNQYDITMYDNNKTMRLVGYQCYPAIDELQQIVDIASSHIGGENTVVMDKHDILLMLADVYNLGRVNGVRQERAKHRK